MKFIKTRLSEAVEHLGEDFPDIEYPEFDEDISIPEEVMPTSFVGAVKATKRQREEANKLIKDRRKLALKATESAPEDRFKRMSNQEEKFNKGEKSSISESLEDTGYALEEVKSVAEFKPWNDAVDTYNKIKEDGKLGKLENIVRELYPDKLINQTLNDLLAFDKDFLFDEINRGDEIDG